MDLVSLADGVILWDGSIGTELTMGGIYRPVYAQRVRDES